MLRLWLGTTGGAAMDLIQYKNWALAAAEFGLHRVYELTRIDYPPLIAWILWPFARLCLWIEPEAALDSRLLTFLIKLPHTLFDGAIAALLYHLVARLGSWGPERVGALWGRLAAIVFLFNPATNFGSVRWAQPDGIHTAFVVLALTLVATRRWSGSAVAIALGGLTKPLAAPFLPLLLAESGERGGGRALSRFALSALLTAGVVFAPFLIAGSLSQVLQRVLVDVNTMPYTSVNAHNLWWLLGAWQRTDRPWIGPIGPLHVGLALFLILYVVLLIASAKRREQQEDEQTARIFSTAAAIAIGFFFLSTHMHENHLLQAVPLTLAVAGRSRAHLVLFVGCVIAATGNMFWHDTVLPYRLPGWLAAPSIGWDPFLEIPRTWGQFVAAPLNALLVGWLCQRAARLAILDR